MQQGIWRSGSSRNDSQHTDPHLTAESQTDTEILRRAISCFEPDARHFHVIRRNSHPHLALPGYGDAALLTLALYQPQRMGGKVLTNVLRTMARTGLHRVLTPRTTLQEGVPELLEPFLPAINPATCGIMLGSPEHRIRRAIASYKTASGWEVAKIAFGPEGAEMLAREADTLTEFSTRTPAAPPCLGLHCGRDITILRMPRISGVPVSAGSFRQALALLDTWISNLAPRPASAFPEWIAIAEALADLPGGNAVAERISEIQLTPVLRHGDFARWNLLAQPNGGLMALDWEWGGNEGMPALDLVHYFLQDARLVRRLARADAIATTLANLSSPASAAYLRKTGWANDTLLPIIASLAYKQGAKHQDNRDILAATVKENLKSKI